MTTEQQDWLDDERAGVHPPGPDVVFLYGTNKVRDRFRIGRLSIENRQATELEIGDALIELGGEFQRRYWKDYFEANPPEPTDLEKLQEAWDNLRVEFLKAVEPQRKALETFVEALSKKLSK